MKQYFSKHFLTIGIMLGSVISTGILFPGTAQSGINLVESSLLPSNFQRGTYRALVIGNDRYQDSKHWRNLKTAITDAEAVKSVLENDYGFSDITLLKNASRREILLALANLSQRAGPHDSVMLYYAGHGYLDPDTQKGYWIPTDAKGLDHTTFLRNSTIRDELSTLATRVQHTLLISDSCFSGSLLRSDTRGFTPDTDVERYYDKVANKKSVQIITAGGVEYVDDNFAQSGHSPFSYFLLSELKSNNRPVITASEVSSNVEKAVANNVEQIPESGVLQGAGDELGEFIFIKLKIDVDIQGIPKDRVKVNVHVTPENATQAEGKPPSVVNAPNSAAKPNIATPASSVALPPASEPTPEQQNSSVQQQAPALIHIPTL